MSTDWRSRASRMVLDEGLCSKGLPDATTQDRRWLWRLESFLAINGTTDGHRAMGRDLREYVNESCVHHWHAYSADEAIPAHRQCLYCNHVEWGDLEGSCNEDDEPEVSP